jgi:hypothetical protein
VTTSIFRCENSIITQLEVNNCITIYEEAGKLKLPRLTNACADFISASWTLFEPGHFEFMDSGLLFELLKRYWLMELRLNTDPI